VSRTGCEFTSCSANRVDEPLNWRRSDEDGQTRDENGIRPALSLQAFENRRFGSHRYAERTAIFCVPLSSEPSVRNRPELLETGSGQPMHLIRPNEDRESNDQAVDRLLTVK
jgi:hypothetical protein